MKKELPHPKSAPVQSPLQSSTKQLRIPSSSSTASNNNSNNNKRTFLAVPPELKAASSSSISSSPPAASIPPVSSTTRNLSSTSLSSYNGSQARHSKDTKRLVDQFYDGSSTPMGSSTNLSTPQHSRSSSSNFLSLHTYASHNGGNDTANASSANELDSSHDDSLDNGKGHDNVPQDYKNFNFLRRRNVDKESMRHDDAFSKDRIQLDIHKLETKIVEKVSKSLDSSNRSFMEDSTEFNDVLRELNAVKSQILTYIDSITSNHALFLKEFDKFNAELVKLYKSLEIIKNFEQVLSDSREKLNLNKKKLFELRAKIEMNEDLRLKQFKMTEIRNKWMTVGFSLILMLYLIWKIL